MSQKTEGELKKRIGKMISKGQIVNSEGKFTLVILDRILDDARKEFRQEERQWIFDASEEQLRQWALHNFDVIKKMFGDEK